MTAARRPLSACAVVLALAVGISGCDSDDGAGRRSVKTYEMPDTVPATFKDSARWRSKVLPGTTPVELSEGIALLRPGGKDGAYRVALVSPYDGATRWVSDSFSNPSPDTPPVLGATSSQGESWVTVETKESSSTVTVDAFAAEGSGDRRQPRTSTSFDGPDEKTLPEVHVDAEGVVVHYSANPDHAEWQEKADKKSKEDGDKKGKKSKKSKDKGKKEDVPKEPPSSGSLAYDVSSGDSTVYSGPGTLRSTWDEGAVVTNPSDHSGFGFVVDGKVAWEASDVSPARTAKDDKGSLVAVGPGMVLARWAHDGYTSLALHSLRTGEVLATLDKANPKVLDQHGDDQIVASPDGEWAAWGPYVFGLRGGESTQVDLHGGEVTAILRGILYVDNATAPLTAQSALKTPPSPVATPASDSSKDSTTHEGIVDIGTGAPLTNTDPSAVPLFVSSASQGVFMFSSKKESRVYSAPLK